MLHLDIRCNTFVVHVENVWNQKQTTCGWAMIWFEWNCINLMKRTKCVDQKTKLSKKQKNNNSRENLMLENADVHVKKLK